MLIFISFLLEYCMLTLKEEALNVIEKLPETATLDDIMYRLYVLDQIQKGKEAASRGEIISVQALRSEMEMW
jgi:hypothetical protein